MGMYAQKNIKVRHSLFLPSCSLFISDVDERGDSTLGWSPDRSPEVVAYAGQRCDAATGLHATGRKLVAFSVYPLTM